MSTRSKRHQPYDLNNPLNWTVGKLKSEIAKKGMNLTANIAKPALLQIYNQISGNGSNMSGRNTPNTSGAIDTDNNNQTLHDNTAQEQQRIIPNVRENSATNSLLGVVSGVQNAVMPLQETVNKLIQDKTTSSSSNNMLAKIYNSQEDVAANQAVVRNQESGIGVDDLPQIEVVSENLRRQILDGKYVNLASLLIPDFDTPNYTTNELSGIELLRQSRRDHRLDMALSFTQFLKAFGIYKRIMCEAFPQRRSELDLYEADVSSMFDHYGSLFYQYYVQFSKKAAAYLEKGLKVDWSKRDTNLFQLIVGGAKCKLCDHCSQADHQSAFCPSQINVPGLSNRRSEQHKGSGRADSSVDRYGRTKMMYQGREICNNFNTRTCTNKVCTYLHVCKKCKSFTHSETNCDSQRSSQPTPLMNKETMEKKKLLPSD